MSAPESLRKGGVNFSLPLNLPRHSKKCSSYGEGLVLAAPRLHCWVFAFLFMFWFIPTSKCIVPWFFGSPLMYFGALNCLCLENFVKQFMLEFMFDLLNWGVIGNGHRPIFDFEMNGHGTLSPLPIFSCLNMRPPSVRWNASMAFACNFVKLSLWNELVHTWFPFWVCGQFHRS